MIAQAPQRVRLLQLRIMTIIVTRVGESACTYKVTLWLHRYINVFTYVCAYYMSQTYKQLVLRRYTRMNRLLDWWGSITCIIYRKNHYTCVCTSLKMSPTLIFSRNRFLAFAYQSSTKFKKNRSFFFRRRLRHQTKSFKNSNFLTRIRLIYIIFFSDVDVYLIQRTENNHAWLNKFSLRAWKSSCIVGNVQESMKDSPLSVKSDRYCFKYFNIYAYLTMRGNDPSCNAKIVTMRLDQVFVETVQ